MLRSLLVQGLTILVQIVVVVVGTYGIKYLRKVQASIEAKIGKDNYENAKSFAKTMVYSIEQQHPDLAGNERFTKVAEAVNAKFGNKLTNDELTNLIEAAVKEMNIMTGKGKTISAGTAILNNSAGISPDIEQETDTPNYTLQHTDTPQPAPADATAPESNTQIPAAQ